MMMFAHLSRTNRSSDAGRFLEGWPHVSGKGQIEILQMSSIQIGRTSQFGTKSDDSRQHIAMAGDSFQVKLQGELEREGQAPACPLRMAMELQPGDVPRDERYVYQRRIQSARGKERLLRPRPEV